MDKFSKNQLERYPVYLKYFKELWSEKVAIVSSPVIAGKLGYSEEQVRKDLQAISKEPGRPKKGRSVSALIEDLETFLGYRQKSSSIVIGAGHLGGALLNYPFEEMGFQILAGFDLDPKKIGTAVGGKKIFALSDLNAFVKANQVDIAVITVPASHAQEVTDLVVSLGIKGIWNFAPIHLEVPLNEAIVNVNLASSLAVLSHQLGAVK